MLSREVKPHANQRKPHWGLYIYINRRKDKGGDPKLKEFLRFVLSPEGQALIPQNSSFLPPSAVNQIVQLEKLK
jgi:phosphate transport system substrate-binding protein